MLSAAASAAEMMMLDNTSSASSRCLERQQLFDSSSTCDVKPVNLLSISSRHVAEQLTYIDAVRLLHIISYFIADAFV